MEQLKQLLSEYHLESLNTSIGKVATITVSSDGSSGSQVDVKFGFPVDKMRENLDKELRQLLADNQYDTVAVNISWQVNAHAVKRNLTPMGDVRNIIAVASAKGGVGKSTTAVNLALALQLEGARVGILDADIYGPSVPRMLGVAETQPVSHDGKIIQPVEGHGLKCMSIGFLVDEDQPMVWRGPMVTQALRQLLNDTAWGELDYLIVDMPPGTGDIQLTLSQQVPVSGAIIVTTPQDIALLDARKGLKMFEKVEVTVLGVIENMSSYHCPECGHNAPIFGHGGGELMAHAEQVPFLGDVPLDIRIREKVDAGIPTLVEDPDSELSANYRRIALKAVAQLGVTEKDYSRLFPKIVVEDS